MDPTIPLGSPHDADRDPLVWAGWVGEADDPPLEPTREDVRDAGRRAGSLRQAFFSRRKRLRGLVALRLGIAPARVVVGYGPEGAPRVLSPEGGPFVSVSGRDGWAALALAGQPVGIDLEPVEPAREPVWSVLGPGERRVLEAEAPGKRAVTFLRYWTAKEAYLKALGAGLARDPASIGVVWPTVETFGMEDGGAMAAGKGRSRQCSLGGTEFVIAVFLRAAG